MELDVDKMSEKETRSLIKTLAENACFLSDVVNGLQERVLKIEIKLMEKEKGG